MSAKEEVIRTMTMTQAKEIANVINHLIDGDKRAAFDAMPGMDVDTLDLMIAFLDAILRDRREVAEHG